jgi:hypothetical protein
MWAVSLITVGEQTVPSDQLHINDIRYSRPTLLREQRQPRKHTHLQQKEGALW